MQRGWSSLRTLNLNMFTLIAMGVGVAYSYSVAAMVLPDAFPESFRAHEKIGVYFEAAAVITVLVLLGQMLELKARSRTGSAIRALLDLAPRTARVLRDGEEREIPLDRVARGDQLRVRPGEKVPVDGSITRRQDQHRRVDDYGEAMPAAKTAGDKVTGGTINTTGSFVMKASASAARRCWRKSCKWSRRPSAAARRSTSRPTRWRDNSAVQCSGSDYVHHLGRSGPEPRFAYAIVNAIAVLISRALRAGLVTPMSIMVGVGRGAQSGILIKDAQAMELMEK